VEVTLGVAVMHGIAPVRVPVSLWEPGVAGSGVSRASASAGVVGMDGVGDRPAGVGGGPLSSIGTASSGEHYAVFVRRRCRADRMLGQDTQPIPPEAAAGRPLRH
jgi:hypothetical protein